MHGNGAGGSDSGGGEGVLPEQCVSAVTEMVWSMEFQFGRCGRRGSRQVERGGIKDRNTVGRTRRVHVSERRAFFRKEGRSKCCVITVGVLLFASV